MTYTAGFSPTGRIRDVLSKKSDRALSALETRTGHSWRMAVDRAKIVPEGLSGGPNLFILAATGARVTDIDGNAFIDLGMDSGAPILGHNHPAVRDAVLAQVARGWNFGLPGAGQLDLARLIQAANPGNERVLLCNSEAEARACALTAARAFRGARQVIGFVSPDGRADDKICAETTADPDLRLVPYGASAAIAAVRENARDLAAVIVEPIRTAAPTLDHTAWLQDLTAACQACGVLMIFDEQFTGFRLAYGGAQELMGVMADLVIYGRTIGGGLPLAAVAGRADVMETFARSDSTERLRVSNPISVAAGAAALSELFASRAVLYPRLNEAGRTLSASFNGFCESERLPVVMQAVGSMFRIVFGDLAGPEPAWVANAETAFYLFTLSRSVFIGPSRRGFLSAAHRAADLDYVTSALAESLRDVRDDGLFAAVRTTRPS